MWSSQIIPVSREGKEDSPYLIGSKMDFPSHMARAGWNLKSNLLTSGQLHCHQTVLPLSHIRGPSKAIITLSQLIIKSCCAIWTSRFTCFHFTDEKDLGRLSDLPKTTQLRHGRLGKKMWIFWDIPPPPPPEPCIPLCQVPKQAPCTLTRITFVGSIADRLQGCIHQQTSLEWSERYVGRPRS